MATQKSSSSPIEDFPSMPIIDNDEATKNEDENMDKTHNDEATKNENLTMDNISTEYGGTVKTVDYIGPDVEFHNVGPKELTSSDLIKINNDVEKNEVKKKPVTNFYSLPKVISGKNLSMMRQQCNLADAGTSGSVHKKAKKHKKRVRKHKCKRKNKSHKPKSPEVPKDDNNEVPEEF